MIQDNKWVIYAYWRTNELYEQSIRKRTSKYWELLPVLR